MQGEQIPDAGDGSPAETHLAGFFLELENGETKVGAHKSGLVEKFREAGVEFGPSGELGQDSGVNSSWRGRFFTFEESDSKPSSVE